MLLKCKRIWVSTEKQLIAHCSRQYGCQASSRIIAQDAVLLPHRPNRTSHASLGKRRRDFFSSNASLQRPQADATSGEQQLVKAQDQKPKAKRISRGKNSPRRVAVEAQRSRAGNELKKSASPGLESETKIITAVCTAEQYDIAQVSHILQTRGHQLDPYGTGLYPQVVHVEIPVETAVTSYAAPPSTTGDIFVFPSGTVVAWAVPDDTLSSLVSEVLSPAAQNPHPNDVEEEDLEYLVDPYRESSTIKGDTIVLGTKPKTLDGGPQPATRSDNKLDLERGRTVDAVLAKIAFSSGLARSTKLAVLESMLNNYFLSTKSIPQRLSLGGRLPFTRSFMLQKTGQLLSIRAQLNLYSELTDSLPDLFWDSRHELGLEGYYDQVARALDTNIRVKTLNDKMDYAQEIAGILRQQLSEQHGVRLEWIIILLIMVEVGFNVWEEYKDYRKHRSLIEI